MQKAADLHREMFAAAEAHDFERMRDLFADDYVYVGTDGVEQGVDASVAVAEMFTRAFPDLRIEIRHRHVPSDDVSILEIVVRGTHQGDLEGIAPTGKAVEVVACNVIEAENGKIVRERDYYDVMSVMQQLGVG